MSSVPADSPRVLPLTTACHERPMCDHSQSNKSKALRDRTMLEHFRSDTSYQHPRVSSQSWQLHRAKRKAWLIRPCHVLVVLHQAWHRPPKPHVHPRHPSLLLHGLTLLFRRRGVLLPRNSRMHAGIVASGRTGSSELGYRAERGIQSDASYFLTAKKSKYIVRRYGNPPKT